jgi:hypothetical protein
MTPRLLGATAAIITTAILCASTAHADPDRDFISYLQAKGAEPIPAESVPEFLHVGHTICADLDSGLVTRAQEARDLHDDVMPHANYGQIAVFIDAAQRTLCPETLGRV